MCGRFALNATPQDLINAFGAVSADDFPRRYNIAPTAMIPVVRERDGRHVELMRWGLIPSWARDESIGAKMNNARAETVTEKPSFRNAFARRRAIVPASGYYEWKTGPGKSKQPYYITLQSGEMLAMAGLWEYWKSQDGREIISCCIITTTPNDLMATIHDRMPVILPKRAWADWLDPKNSKTADLQSLLVPSDTSIMQAWPVSREVNRGSAEGAALIEPSTLSA